MEHRERASDKSMLKTIAKRVRDAFHHGGRVAASRYRWPARLYYGVGNAALSREAMAMAAGQLRYKQERDSEAGSRYLLRRNIHRLEKGLIMRPRKASFAAGYIEETVAMFLRNEKNSAEPEITWARDVLNAYFDACDDSDQIVRDARSRFREIVPATTQNRTLSVPYVRDSANASAVSYDAFTTLSRHRRSVRWFTPQRVDRELIDQALLPAAQAPSACNRQPYVFRIFDDPRTAAEIAAIPMGTKGFSQQVPAIAVIVGQLRAYPYERDRHAIYIDASLAAMSFMFALETLGLSSCPINWPDQEPHETRMQNRLNLDADERVILLIAIGYADKTGMVPRSEKRGLDAIRVYDGAKSTSNAQQ